MQTISKNYCFSITINMNILCKFFEHKITERKNLIHTNNISKFEGKCVRCKYDYYVVEIDKTRIYTKI